MPRIPIAQLDDPRLAPYRDLPHRKALRSDGLLIAEGRLLVERLLKSRYETASLLVDTQHADEIAALVPEPIPLYVAERSLLEQVIGFNFHRGVLACGRRGPEVSIDDGLGSHRESDRPLTVVVCVDVRDQENVGGILRNCAAFGVDAVVFDRRCADPFSRRALRVSMGSAFTLPIVAADDALGALRRLREAWGVSIAATVLDPAAEDLARFQRPRRMAITFGEEGHGLPAELIAACDRRLTIPMRGGADSLNVAAASAIFLHHLATQLPGSVV